MAQYRTGITNLPLHGGKAPRWLFQRMVKLSREIVRITIEEYGPTFFLERLANPYWFQSLGCVLGFDWHSSGLTTTTCGALKLSLTQQPELGVFFCGGKGGTSRKTPNEITIHCDELNIDSASLVYASKMSAKIDNTALQDGYQLYHHSFAFDSRGGWAVIQQGMHDSNRMARRYHWFSKDVVDFVNEPQSAICSDQKQTVLNLVAHESRASRQLEVELVRNGVNSMVTDLSRIDTLTLPQHHPIYAEDFSSTRLNRILHQAAELKPRTFEELLTIPGVGPKTIRALTLVAELIYGQPPSFKDPARYAFAHGGKDGYPFPVERKTYDNSIEILSKVVQKTKIDRSEKQHILQKLHLPLKSSRGH